MEALTERVSTDLYEGHRLAAESSSPSVDRIWIAPVDSYREPQCRVEDAHPRHCDASDLCRANPVIQDDPCANPVCLRWGRGSAHHSDLDAMDPGPIRAVSLMDHWAMSATLTDPWSSVDPHPHKQTDSTRRPSQSDPPEYTDPPADGSSGSY